MSDFIIKIFFNIKRILVNVYFSIYKHFIDFENIKRKVSRNYIIMRIVVIFLMFITGIYILNFIFVVNLYFIPVYIYIITVVTYFFWFLIFLNLYLKIKNFKNKIGLVYGYYKKSSIIYKIKKKIFFWKGK